jgi:hypothetical protein
MRSLFRDKRDGKFQTDTDRNHIDAVSGSKAHLHSASVPGKPQLDLNYLFMTILARATAPVTL